MSIQNPLGRLSIAVIFLTASNIGIAASAQDRIYIGGSVGAGIVDAESGDVDVETIGFDIGYQINHEYYLEGGFANVDFEDSASSNLLSMSAGIHRRIKPKITLYGTLGGAYWDSSDFDDSETGAVLGAGLLWGDSQLRYQLGYKYYIGTKSDSIFDEIHTFSIGVRYNFGKIIPHQARSGAGSYSPDRVTACSKEHKDLFFLCDPKKEQQKEQ
ncbi:MAG: hypothetical protein CSA49_02955 [Gammaproteobacteria bacterium]|nr:MAG: hypothetical protein CSA49_02955 [Gammaproteobacteria bacterium]